MESLFIYKRCMRIHEFWWREMVHVLPSLFLVIKTLASQTPYSLWFHSLLVEERRWITVSVIIFIEVCFSAMTSHQSNLWNHKPVYQLIFRFWIWALVEKMSVATFSPFFLLLNVRLHKQSVLSTMENPGIMCCFGWYRKIGQEVHEW